MELSQVAMTQVMMVVLRSIRLNHDPALLKGVQSDVVEWWTGVDVNIPFFFFVHLYDRYCCIRFRLLRALYTCIR